MKSFLKYLGLALVLVGVAGFAALYYYHITFVNKLMAVPFVLVLLGTVLYVWMTKRESRY